MSLAERNLSQLMKQTTVMFRSGKASSQTSAGCDVTVRSNLQQTDVKGVMGRVEEGGQKRQKADGWTDRQTNRETDKPTSYCKHLCISVAFISGDIILRSYAHW